MARPIWRGSLSFGLVAIPVQLHTAVRENRPKFRLLHAKDKSPIKYERVCQRDGTPVAWEDLVKGYEYQKGRYVVLTKDDFKAAALEKDRRVQVSRLRARRGDRRSLLRSAVLPAARQGRRARLRRFQRGARTDRRIGIGKVVMRERQHLVAVESIDNRLVLTMMRFADEIVEAPEMADVERIKVPPRNSSSPPTSSGRWPPTGSPEQYTDDYQENLQEVIKAKLKGETIELEEKGRPMRAEVVDLAERLRASLKAAEGSRKSRASKPSSSSSKVPVTKTRGTKARRKRAAMTRLQRYSLSGDRTPS